MIICFREKEVGERKREWLYASNIFEWGKERNSLKWQRCINKWQGSEMRMYTIQHIQDQNFILLKQKQKPPLDKKRDGINR